ncbi:hypothetical protein GCM10028801_11680 [Nocardioides maradonensis]
MKKLALAVVAAVVAMTGLGTVQSAQAAPYPGAVPTKVVILSARTDIPKGSRPDMWVRVEPVSGNATVKAGNLRMTCTRPLAKGGVRTLNGPQRGYRGGRVLVSGPVLSFRATWTCTVRYTGGSSVFTASSATRKVVVR